MHPPKIPDYTLGEYIGEGSTGSVWLSDYHGTGRYALKALHGLAINRQLLSDALVKVYEAADHPGLVKVHDFDLASPQAYIAMDLCAEEVRMADGREVLRPRTLETLCGALPAEDSWRIAIQIADAMSYLHRNRVIHVNMKPSNVLFGDGETPRAMIADFCQGLLGGIEQIDPGESVFYAAPEQLTTPDHFFEGHAERWDVYSFGATIFRLLTGRLPRLDDAATHLRREKAKHIELGYEIDLEQVAEALNAAPAVAWPTAAESDLEIERRRIIDSCLELDPTKRPVDMREVLEALRDTEFEIEHRDEVEHFETEKTQLTAQAKGAKRRAAIFGIGAAAAAGFAAFALVDRFGDDTPDSAKPSTSPKITATGQPMAEAPPAGESEALRESKTQLAAANDDLQHTQAALDSVFEMIAARDAQGNPLYVLPDGALGSVLNYYQEFGNRHFGNPEKADQVAGAMNNAGELKLILGDHAGAVVSLASAVELLDNLETGGGDPGDLLQRRARAYANLADAQTASDMPSAAIESAKMADNLFKQFADTSADDVSAKRQFAASSLELGRKLNDGNQPGEAGIYVRRCASLLRGLEANKTVNESDLAALAAVSFENGRIERSLGERESAIKSQIDAIDRYLALLEARPEVEDYRFQLARAYGEAADVAALLGESGEASSANKEATRILTELADDAPEYPSYRYELARRLRAIASSMRDKSGAAKASAEQAKAVVLLEDVVASHPNNHTYTYELAIVSGIQADLLGEAGKKDDAIKSNRRAVDLMQDLLTNDVDPESGDGKRPKYRHALAALYGKLGHHTERTGDKAAAGHCFDKALRQYQSLVGANPNDQTAVKGIAWAEDRISRLK